MSKMKYTQFDGIAPATTAQKLPSNFAQTAENVDLGAGRLDPWKVPLLVQAITFNASIYPWRRSGTTEWLSWPTDVDVARSPVVDDDYERIYISDGVKPYMRGRDSGVTVDKYMERTTGSTPTATATDRVGFGAAEMAAAACVWAGQRTVYYVKTSGGVSTLETSTTLPVNFIGTLLSATRDKNTGVWTLEFFFSPQEIPLWSYLAPAGTRVTGITVDMTGAWSVTFNGITQALGTAWTLNDGSEDYGIAIAVGALPTPSYTIGKNSVAGVAFTASLQMIPEFDYNKSPQTVYYVQTLVDDWGMEGPPSEASNAVTRVPGQKVVLSNFGAALTKRRFYRSAAGDDPADDTFYFLTELTSGSTYDDILTDDELGDEIPLFENPPDDLQGIVAMPGDFFVGFRENELLFSEPKYPWSWPSKYRVAIDWNIVGLGVNGNDCYIMTQGLPMVTTGYHPERMNMAKIPLPQACVSKRSIASLGPFIIYASPDGLVGLSGGGGRLLTENLYARAQWQALGPTNMIGAVHDNVYFGFLATGGITFAPSERADAMTTHTQTVTEAYYDLIDDMLYIVQASGGGTYSIYKWNQGATNMTMRWHSKREVSGHLLNWTCARIDGSGSKQITLNVYSDAKVVASLTADVNKAFRLPKLDPIRITSVEVKGADSVDMFAIATNMKELTT